MKCYLCNSEIKEGTGIIYVKKDGSFLNFCSSKCEKNFKMGRKTSKLKWARKEKKKSGEKK